MGAARVSLRVPSARRLLRSLEVACQRELVKAGFKVNDLRPDEPWHLTRAYCRVLHRSIEPRPRVVLRSRELQAQLASLTDKNLFARVAAVEREMKLGLQLNMRLSRKYYHAAYNDHLLNDLNVHHFHLGDRANDPAALCKTTKELLFGTVEKDKVYLVHLGDHASFRKISFEEVMFNNWPHLFGELTGLRGGADAVSPEDRSKARHCGLSMMVEFHGKVYMPPWSGQSTAGTSTWVNPRMDDLIHQVEAGHTWLLEMNDWIVENMTNHGRTDPTLALEVHVEGLTVWFADEAARLWMCPRSGELLFGGVPTTLSAAKGS